MKLFLALAFAAVAPAFAAEAPSRLESGPAVLNPLAAIKLEDLAETRDRPLFSPSRRPPPIVEPPQTQAPAVADVKPAADEPPPFDLVGVVVGTDARFVLLASHGGSGVARLREGDEREGWRVGEINVRSVTLKREGREESLALAGPASSPVATAAPEPPEVAERQTSETAMTPGPVRDEYKRLMRELAVRR